MNVTAFLSAGVGGRVSWVTAPASFGTAGALPVELARTLGEGAGVGMFMLRVVQWILANSRRHVREKCFATGLRTEQTGTVWIFTETRLFRLPRSRLRVVSGVPF